MTKSLYFSGLALLLAASVPAQTVVIPPGKLAVFKGGDNTGIYNYTNARVAPCFVQVFDPVTNNQAAPEVNFPLPTNQPNGVWINPHAGSEGAGLSRTANRQFLALEGYTGNILSPTAAKPSSDPTVYRGVAVLDAFTNEAVVYQDLANWFGLPPGVTQNNPTGIASTDGTNFWGTGNVTGTSSEAAGTLFYNSNVSATPLELQNYLQAATEARIINGVLYVVAEPATGVTGGVYNFLDPLNNDALVPLPRDPNSPNPVEHPVLTNVFVAWGPSFTKVSSFDMDKAGTTIYAADQTVGIIKFTNTGSAWVQAPYMWTTTNIGTKSQVKGNQGCFSLCVDFSGANPVIYATTMENGQVVNTSQGHQNNNRLIRIVDTGMSPGTSVVAQTLATAQTTNEFFGAVDFTPDLGPEITFVTAGHSTTNGGSATYSVTADSVYPLSYQWLQNGSPLLGQTSSNLMLSSLDTTYNGDTYQCIVTNQYGMVTSTPPSTLTVNASPVAPTITNAVANVSAYIGGVVTFAPITPTGTEPFTYQWYFGTNQLMDDGMTYIGSLSNSLTVSNLVATNAGNFYLVASNSAGFASNKVDVLAVNYHLPTIDAGEPASAITFVGYTVTIPGQQSGGSPPITNQWYFGTNKLSNAGDFSGVDTDTLTISPAALSNGGSYKIVVSNPGGSVTSAVATVTVLTPPPLSSVSYSNQVYTQNFDSLPDPGSNSVNSINNPLDPGSINGLAYSLANPFDFAFPVVTGSYVGGLGLSNTLYGWYGAADTTFAGVDGITRFGAQDGDQTTGGVIDFGLNDNSPILGTNRALGLLSTGTTGATTFALKLINTSGQSLNYIDLAFQGEMWRNSTGDRTMSFGYTLDNTANSFTLSAQSISNSTYVPALAFSYPATNVTGVVLDGSQPANSTNLSVSNFALSSPWPAGGALWLIWGIDFYGAGQGNGYAIDNLSFYASANVINPATPPITLQVGLGSYNPVTKSFTLSFTNASGAFFNVYTTTNLAPPINWQLLGAPTEIPNTGYSTYQFSDTAASNTMRFYQVITP